MVAEHNGHKGAALIYCRVSTKHQEDDGTSLDSQVEACVKHATFLGYTVGRITREVYSGAELHDRPLLARDRADVKAGKFQALVAYTTDRLARDPIHVFIVAEECDRAGAELIFVTEPLDRSDEGQLLQYVRGYTAKIEREKIKERSLRGKRTRVENGKLLNAGTELYGYRRDKVRGVREVIEPEAAIVRQIFDWYTSERVSLREIARRLEARGVPSAGRGKYTFRDGREARWTPSQLVYMMRNPAYKGETVAWCTAYNFRQKRHTRRPQDEWVMLPEGTTPALVSPEVWDAAQARREPNRAAAARNKHRFYLLRGLITCAECGRPRSPVASHEHRRYRCRSLETLGGSCGGHIVPADAIEAWVWDKVSAVLRDPSIIAAELERRKEEGGDDLLQSDLTAANRALAKIERQQEKLLGQFRRAEDDSFPWELVRREIARAEHEKDQFRAVIADLKARIAAQQSAQQQLEAVSAYCARVATNLDRLSEGEKRLALEAMRVQVVANGNDWRLTGSVPIESGDKGLVLSSPCW